MIVMYISQKKRAIKSFILQREKINDPKYYSDWQWIAHTCDLITKYIGNESAFYNTLSQFRFQVLNDGTLSNKQILSALNSKEKDAIRLVNECIEYIKTNGILKQKKSNFLSRISDGWLIFVIGTLIPGIFYLGYKTHEITTDYGLRNEEKIKSLQKEVDSLKTLIGLDSSEKMNQINHPTQ